MPLGQDFYLLINNVPHGPCTAEQIQDWIKSQSSQADLNSVSFTITGSSNWQPVSSFSVAPILPVAPPVPYLSHLQPLHRGNPLTNAKMEELFQTIVEQNEKTLSVLERIAKNLEVLYDINLCASAIDEKLDVLTGINISATSIDRKLDVLDNIETIATAIDEKLYGLGDGLDDIKNCAFSIDTTAAEVIKAVEDVECAIRE